MRWPIRYQILLPLAGTMIAAIVGGSLLDAWLAARRTEQRTEQQLRQLARTLQESGFPLTNVVLRQMHGLSGADFILADEQGHVLSSSTSQKPDLRRPFTPARSWNELRMMPGFSLGAEEYFHAAWHLPPRAGQTQPALLHIYYSARAWQAARWESAYPPLVVGAASLVLFTVLTLAIAGRLSRPIRQLRSQAARLARGDFQTVPVPDRNDEIRDLAQSVNTLAMELDTARRAMQRTERLALLGQLSAGMAHDLRNDVTGALMAVGLHQRHCESHDRETLEVAVRQLALTEKHLQRFLAVGKPEPPRYIRCDPREIAEELVTLIQPACRHRRVELSVQHDLAHETKLQADPDQLRQLLLNLCLNAIEAASSGGWVRIETTDRMADWLVMRVIDSGQGPPRSIADRLFEPFITSKPEGVGLGLAVARQIAELHGGSLNWSRGENSTCFELRLPVEVAAQPSTTVSQPTRSHPGLEVS